MTDPAAVALQPTTTARGFMSLAGNSMIFVLGAVAGRAIGLILLPILTRMLTPEGLGQADVLLSLGTAMTATLTFGMDIVVLRVWFDQSDDPARRRLVSSAYLIAAIGGVGAALALVPASGWIGDTMFGGSLLQPAVLMLPLIGFAGTLVTINQTVLRAQNRAISYAAVNGVVVVLYATLAVTFLHAWRTDGNAVLAAWTIALASCAILGAALIRRVAFGSPSRAATSELLRLGLPLAPAVGATLVAEFVNRTILLAEAGAAQVAYFTVAGRFAGVAALSVGGFQLAWQPRAYALGADDSGRARLAVDALWIVGVSCAVVTAVAAAAPEIVRLVTGPGYDDARAPLAFSLLAVIASALYLIAALPSAMAKATRDLGLAVGLSVVVAIALNLLLVSRWGGVATAGAIAAGQLVAAVVAGRLGARRIRLPVDWPRIAAMAAASAGVVVAVLLGDLSLPLRLLLALAQTILLARLLPWKGELSAAVANARSRWRS